MSLLTNLVYLDLSDNCFGDIDVDFSGMTRVKTLKITGLNTRGHIQKQSISETLSDMISLEHVDFQFTPLHSLPAEIGNLLNLTHVDISSCSLTELPPSFTKLSNLATLLAEGNCFDDLPEHFGDLHSLRTLDLG